jgi:hypothetical protein
MCRKQDGNDAAVKSAMLPQLRRHGVPQDGLECRKISQQMVPQQ